MAGAEGTDAAAPAHPAMGRLVAALLRCCAGENRTILSRRVQRLAAQCLGELGAVDPGRIDMPAAPSEKLSKGTAGTELARALLCDHIARTVRGANDVDMLDAAALAVQEVLVHVGCRPASVRAEDVINHVNVGNVGNNGSGGGGGGNNNNNNSDISGHPGGESGGGSNNYYDAAHELPDGATPEGELFWSSLPEDVRVLLAPGLTSMYCLTQKPAKPPAMRPLYQSPGGPTFRRWMYAWCRALAARGFGGGNSSFIPRIIHA